MMMITAEMFKEATGHEPENDDLERVNCPNAGKFMHLSCGWNREANLPVFMAGPEKSD
jgi:hypothetical protein